jgi:putative flippase GtrA
MPKLSQRDLLFALINGALIGLLAPYIFSGLGAALPIPYILFVFFITILAVIGVAFGYFLALRVRPFFFQLAKFGLIGVSNTVIDLGLYTFLIYLSGSASGISITLFKTLSVAIAIINSYIWNKYWSFQKKEMRDVSKEFTHFVSVSLVGLVLNVAITSFITNLITPGFGLNQTAWATLAGATASGLVLLWNFLGYKLFVFKK